MTTAKVVYEGNLRTQALHLQSNNQIITDAPTDNHGKGEAFSPTDLLASSLASCMLTIMGIKADSMGLDIIGTRAEVTKVMAAEPRRVDEIRIEIHFKQPLEARSQKVLEQAALACPVAKSIHPDIKQIVNFYYTKQ